MQRDCDYAGKAGVEPACFEALSPSSVWQALVRQIQAKAPGA